MLAIARRYDHERKNLGEEFLREVDAALARIQINPFRQPIYYREYRRIITGRFPYKIFYVIGDDRLIVFRVLHVKQDHYHELK
jgi:plasmid stabilization system protein ParE